MTAQGYPEQLDVMWAASDRDGQIAVFFSAGEGPIPKPFLDYEDYEQEELESYVLGFPDNGELTRTGGVGPDSGYEHAARGCFVFDWSDVHRVSGLLRSYELCAVPVYP